MKIVGILLRSAVIVGIAVGISLIVLRLVQIPGSKKIDRLYPDPETEDTRVHNKGTRILAILSILLFLVIIWLLWMI